MKKLIVILAVAMMAADGFAQATLAKYNRVKEGMTFSSVKAILGSPSREIMSFEYEGHSEAAYQWDGAEEFSSANIGFVNGKVTAKSQIFLK